ncbi:hypothetical protein ONS95_009131 [Cadophora gregata]|uniref:uncharacterized protein n=1 Tax=Cadophora gregata TaxID=51156 RepID=UPI0026DABC3F|nr:uncharacterized protein ONS95_009131 [Cadophora gregata]KAK0124148.1 hypothetical protein ONS95_009131 [Cadophora gregata]KAK0130478.1 hypothetical protein ONS96_000997 [Cadophora gregata f. sp. sojae]
MGALSAIDRRHHSELQPIKTISDTPYESQTQARQRARSSAHPTTLLPSPSIVAARAYHIATIPIEQQRRESFVESQELPRRHSLLSTTKTLALQLGSFRFSAGHHGLSPVPEAGEISTKVKVEELSDVSTNEVHDAHEILSPGWSASTLCAKPQEYFLQVPFQYTHNHLRDWGFAYLGNSATADAFVNAVSLRRPSMAVGLGNEAEIKLNTHLVTIRARVVPRGKDRKPFLMQKQFDIEELRKSIPEVTSEPGESEGSPVLRRSPRTRRSSTQVNTDIFPTEITSTKRKHRSPSPGNGSLPIHIEYALHYLPVLGALMLSGHVRKGDSIDLPIPHPDAWRDVLTYIYTGRGNHGRLTAAMKENILFLAGHA